MIMAGRLKHRINILAKSYDTDDYGEQVEVYTPIVKEVPCEVRMVSGVEEGTAATSTKIQLKIRMRPRDINLEHYVEYRGNKYRVVYPDVFTNRREMFLYAEANI